MNWLRQIGPIIDLVNYYHPELVPLKPLGYSSFSIRVNAGLPRSMCGKGRVFLLAPVSPPNQLTLPLHYVSGDFELLFRQCNKVLVKLDTKGECAVIASYGRWTFWRPVFFERALDSEMSITTVFQGRN
jgi:hypothetical protein